MAIDVASEEMASRVKKASSYASAMAAKYLSARQKLAILSPLLSDEIASKFENSYGAHAFVALRLTLVLDLVRDIWAFALDPDDRAPSLKNVWSLMENADLHAALRETAMKPYSVQDTLSEDDWTTDEMAHWRFMGRKR